MKQIYAVIGSTGLYDDKNEWVARCFEDYQDAFDWIGKICGIDDDEEYRIMEVMYVERSDYEQKT